MERDIYMSWTNEMHKAQHHAFFSLPEYYLSNIYTNPKLSDLSFEKQTSCIKNNMSFSFIPHARAEFHKNGA